MDIFYFNGSDLLPFLDKMCRQLQIKTKNLYMRVLNLQPYFFRRIKYTYLALSYITAFAQPGTRGV
jgi:hypothetical protein